MSLAASLSPSARMMAPFRSYASSKICIKTSAEPALLCRRFLTTNRTIITTLKQFIAAKGQEDKGTAA